MRKLASPLLASFPLQTRRTLFSNLARWSAGLERVSFSQSSQPPSSSHSPSSSPPSGQPPFRTFSAPPQVAIDSTNLPYHFKTGVALFAKRTPRPFPPPFLAPPSDSFSDALSTHRQIFVDDELIQGHTNGDDSAFASSSFIAVNDGVGAWSTRPKGHAGLWSRLILHFWAVEMQHTLERRSLPDAHDTKPDPVRCLQRAYERTLEATAEPNDWHGTTTATGAQLFYKNSDQNGHTVCAPLVYVTNLGDSQTMILRPKGEELVYKTQEQYHWFDCPRQLGTNSPDTPLADAVMDIVEIQEGDMVLAMSDGVIDNLWEHEIIAKASKSLKKWESGEVEGWESTSDDRGSSAAMQFVAHELVAAAKEIALDPFAESPFMEHAIEEGFASRGGKLDDISVVAAVCQKTNQDVSDNA